MAARPLSEAVQQAEEAISGGNYQLAVETCRRVLGQFPEFATAHRLLAEAHFEAGEVDAAEEAFRETLRRDPQSSAAYAGLATIAEGKGDVESALAYAQVAWEIMPQRADLRDRVAGLSERLYGKGGRLHLTRPALTSLHFRAGRWSRAAAEAASVLIEHPTRVDVQLRMAEALWRRGSLAAAANACHAVLESTPSAVMALLMVADIERRDGHQEEATQLLERARAIDPDGVRAADLVTIGSTDLAEFMLPAHMPEFDDAAELAVEVERPRIAPAPDFSWTETTTGSTADAPDAAQDDSLIAEAPVAAEASMEAVEDDFDVSLPDDAEIEAARPPAKAQRGYTSMLESLEDEGLMPFRLDGEGQEDEGGDVESTAEHDGDDDLFGLVSDEEIEAARPPDERPHGYTTLLNSLDETGVAPFEIEGAPGYPTEDGRSVEAEADAPMSTGSIDSIDYGTDLTSGWDDIDAEIERATPTDEEMLKGYTGELRDLDEIGVQPFSVEGVAGGGPYEDQQEEDVDDAYAADLSFLNEAPEREASQSMGVEAMSLDVDLTDGWATIDEEIQNAIPSETPPGYTDELNDLSVSGVEPFFVEADEAEEESEPEEQPVETISEEDVVSDDLAAGIELWSFDREPAAGMVEESVVPRESEVVSETELFDFADTESGDETLLDQVETSELEASASPDSATSVTAEQDEILVEPDLVEPVADEITMTQPQDGDAIRSAIMRLGVDRTLFERARQAKARLVEDGRIQGDQLLPGVEPPVPPLEALEQRVQENPEDLAARRELAAALLDVEDFERAFAEIHWMYRTRQPFEELDLSNLTRAAESDGAHQGKSHRLLGAVYRRTGNYGMSARHYQMSLAGHRGVEKEA